MSGDDAFDVAFGHDILLPRASLDGAFVNLYNVPYLDFTAPWWFSYGMKEFTVLGQCYTGFSFLSYRGLATGRCAVYK